MNNRDDVPMHNSPTTVNNTDSFEKAKLSTNSENTKDSVRKCRAGGYNESNRYCTQNRRSRARGDPEGDPQNYENPGGRPLTEIIDTRYLVLYGAGI